MQVHDRQRWSDLAPAERWRDRAAKLGKTSRQVSPIRSRLIEKGLIYTTSHGYTDFTVPQFELYLRRLDLHL
jgi:hypothetical protein